MIPRSHTAHSRRSRPRAERGAGEVQMALMWRYKGYQVPDHIAHWVEEDPAKRMTRIDTGCDRPVMGLWLTFGRPSDSPL